MFNGELRVELLPLSVNGNSSRVGCLGGIEPGGCVIRKEDTLIGIFLNFYTTSCPTRKHVTISEYCGAGGTYPQQHIFRNINKIQNAFYLV